MFIKRGIYYLAVNRGELSELLKVNFNVWAFLKKVSNQLEEVVKTVLNHILLFGGSLSHGSEVGLNSRTHYYTLLSFHLELSLLVLKVVLGKEAIRQLNVDYLDIVTDC